MASIHFVWFADPAETDRNERRKNRAASTGPGPSPVGRDVRICSTIGRGGYRTEKCGERVRRFGDLGHRELVVPTARSRNLSTPSDRDKN